MKMENFNLKLGQRIILFEKNHENVDFHLHKIFRAREEKKEYIDIIYLCSVSECVPRVNSKKFLSS